MSETTINNYEQLAYMIMFGLDPSDNDIINAEFLKGLSDEDNSEVIKYLVDLGYDEDSALDALNDYITLHAYALMDDSLVVRKFNKLSNFKNFKIENFQFSNGLNVSQGINSATPVIQVQGTERGIRSSYIGDPNEPVYHGPVTVVTELEVNDEEFDSLEDALADSHKEYEEATDAASIPSNNVDTVDLITLDSAGYDSTSNDDNLLMTSPSNKLGPLPSTPYKKKKDSPLTIESVIKRRKSNKHNSHRRLGFELR